MAVFLVTAVNDSLTERLESLFPGNMKRISAGQWLVSSPLTPTGISKLIDPERGGVASHVVVLVTSYYGWHDKDIWAWIEQKKGAE